MRRLTAILLLLCMLLSACSTDGGAQELLTVFYCAADGGMESGSAIAKEMVGIPAGADRLHEALHHLTTAPEDAALCSAFPSSVRIETYRLENMDAAVSLSEGYLSLTPIQQTKLRACLVLTLCELEEVESVSLYAEERLLERGLKADTFLPESLPEGDGGTELRFWTPDLENACLVSELQTVKQRGSTSVAETVLRQLMPMLYDFGLPAETQILSVSRKEGVCIVDFSSEFRNAEALPPTELRLMLYSIINTLTELDTVESVMFRCEGSGIGTFGSMELIGALRHEAAFTADMLARPDFMAVTLYLLAANGKLVPVRAAIPTSGSAEHPVVTAVQALLNQNTYWGYQMPFLPGTELLSFSEKDGVAELVLGEGFWSNAENFRDLTAYALAATAVDAGAVNGVRIATKSRAYRNREILRKNGDLIAEG